jgi:predicted nucleotidyltransferase
MSAKLPALDYDEEALAAVCRRWSVLELAVFGSAARDEMRPESDIDFMVQFLPGAVVTLADFVHMNQELEAMFGRKVDLVTPSVLENRFRRRTIEPDLTVVYAA